MAVVVVQYGTFIRISGTIAEVLGEINNQKIHKTSQVVFYNDDNTDAVAVVGRII